MSFLADYNSSFQDLWWQQNAAIARSRTTLPLKKRKVMAMVVPDHVPLTSEQSITKPMNTKSITEISPQGFLEYSVNQIQGSSCIVNGMENLKEYEFSPRKGGMWLARFKELVAFRKLTGHCNVPQRYAHNIPLGKWVHQQRQEFKILPDARAPKYLSRRFKALIDVGFEFENENRAEALWHHRFQELQKFKIIHGDCNVPQNYIHNKSLGKWVSRQRFEYANMCGGLSTRLSKNRIEALNAVGFTWSMRKSRKRR